MFTVPMINKFDGKLILAGTLHFFQISVSGCKGIASCDSITLRKSAK